MGTKEGLRRKLKRDSIEIVFTEIFIVSQGVISESEEAISLCKNISIVLFK